MVKYKALESVKIKAKVAGPKSTYTYNLTPGEWEVLPLSEGNGTYTVTVYRNVSGSKYASVLSQSFGATLKNEFTTFLYPNQYVDYISAPKRSRWHTS